MHHVSCNCSKCNYALLSKFINEKYKRQKQEESLKHATDKDKNNR